MGGVDIFSNHISKAGYVLAGAFSLTVICVIAFFVLDEVTARFSVIALSALIVLMTQPGESLKFFENKKWLGLTFDLIIISSFVWSAWWFFKVKEELWTGFYMATNSNVLAGLLGIISLIILTFRSWGWSLVIMAIVFIIFGFSGPWLPGLLEHFGVNIRDFMQIVWYSFDGVFGRTTGLVADNVLIFLIFVKNPEFY